jgi:hypothetical protein
VLLGAAGVAATDATIVSLLTLICFALASLPGAVVLLRSGMPLVPEAAEATAAA